MEFTIFTESIVQRALHDNRDGQRPKTVKIYKKTRIDQSKFKIKKNDDHW